MYDATEKLKKALSQDLTDYRAIPFWSWNNELDEQKLVEQIDQMYEAGMGGFIMHARLGLTTEYLGEKWFSCIDACLKRAKQLGMNAWVYDENGWPSGFVGGKLLEKVEYRAQFLEYSVKNEFDQSAFAVFVKDGESFSRVTSAKSGVLEYHTIYLRISPANTDILNPEVVDAFIEQTHEEYYKRFKDSFGKELTGFFTDEPQYYRWGTPYSPNIAKTYSEKYNLDIKDGLIWLFVHNENGHQFRMRYYTIANDLYVDVFYKKLYDWCEAHNCKLTGHSIEENNLPGQMYGGAGCMPTYEFEHIPGIDSLGRRMTADVGSKQLGSVASQLGIKSLLTETFGCAGSDCNPRQLRGIGEAQYFNGVNLMCHHLYPYSMAGQAKHDHPPIFSTHSNWWKGFRQFNDYFTNLGYLIANTEEQYDILVIHPLRDVYLEWIRSEATHSVMDKHVNFENTLLRFRKSGLTYQFADERILSRHAKVEDGKLVVGKNKYDCIFLPKMQNITGTTLSLLKQFKGKLFLDGKPTLIDGVNGECDLTSNVTFEEIVANKKVKFNSEDGVVRMTSRKGETGEYLFIVNYSDVDDKKIDLKEIAKQYKSLDLQNFTLENLENEQVLPPYGSLILQKVDDAKPVCRKVEKQEITPNFAVSDITKNYLVIDFCSISYDGVNFGKTEFNQKIFEDLLRADYKGKVYLRHTFTLTEKMPLKLVMEKGRFFSLKVNGNDITLGESDFDFNYCEGDITQFVKEGENEFVYGIDYFQHDGVHFALFDPLATESLRNCLYYDTHIENIYLKGDFVVNKDMSLSSRTKLPEINTDNNLNGYPFFMGQLKIAGSYENDGVGNKILCIKGNYQMAEVFVGDKNFTVVLDDKIDLTKYLVKGKNDITIIVYSSLRNLFGPHHCKREIELETGISPYLFTMRGSWGDNVPDCYTKEHVTVPFGVEKIEMITKN